MIKNYLKIILRNIIKQKLYSIINISGLALGMACCMLILLWVSNELSYDRFNEKADRIVRITEKYNNPGSGYNVHFARCSGGWEKNLPKELPEVEAVTRLNFQKCAVSVGDKNFFETNFFVADSNIFSVFSFPFVIGDPLTALKEPNSIILSQSMAKKYFGEENPMGKTLTIMGERDSIKKVMAVKGIMKDIPMSSHFHPDFLSSIDSQSEQRGWFYTYILLREDYTIKTLEEKIPLLIKKHFETNDDYYTAPLQRLTDIHLYSDIDREIEPNGNIFLVYVFAIIAIFILLIACINFINLSIAGWTKRTKEIGIRKVLGGRRKELMVYVYTESMLYNIFGFIFAFLLVELLISILNPLLGINLSLNLNTHSTTFLLLGCIGLFSGFISGCYPAFFISSFQPVLMLKMGIKNFMRLRPGSIFSPGKILIIFQFAISIIVIVCAIIINSQLDYIKNKNLGLSKDNTIVIRDISPPIQAGYHAFKNELSKYPEISFVSASMDPPSVQVLDYSDFETEGIVKEQNNPKVLNVLVVDDNFINTMSIDVIAGRGFSSYNSNQAAGEYILNESAIKFIGWIKPEDAIGKKFKLFLSVPEQYKPKEGTIVGVIKDFHFSTLHKKIEPMVLFVKPQFLFCILVKVQPHNVEKALNILNAEWKNMFPDLPFEYKFLDELYAGLYKNEERMEIIINIFSFMAIFIACLGLFGLVSFSIVQRTKEVGIRKVLGASITELMTLLSKDFIKLVLVANILAWPISYYLSNKWLQDFVYRVDITLWVFIVSAILSFIIAILTIILQVLKAARANPMEALHYE